MRTNHSTHAHSGFEWTAHEDQENMLLFCFEEEMPFRECANAIQAVVKKRNFAVLPSIWLFYVVGDFIGQNDIVLEYSLLCVSLVVSLTK